MEIQEYQAKEIFKKYNIPILKGVPILDKNVINSSIEELINKSNASRIVVKAQVLAGGRGKAGGVRIASSKEDARKIAEEMWGMRIVTPQTDKEGKTVKRLYLEEGCEIVKEYYLSIIVNRENKSISFIASSEGGVNIEEVAERNPEKIISFDIGVSSGVQEFHVRKICFGLKIPKHLQKTLAAIVENLYGMFIDMDCSQIEINPLCIIKKEDGLEEFVALDAKVGFDDNGLYRHKEIEILRSEEEEDKEEIKARLKGLSYIKMDGAIGCMVNGAGLAMATMDIINHYGSKPANFLDVGGGADKERVQEAFRIILSDKKVRGILVNIFGGIVKCDVIAQGIVDAAKEISISIPIVVRLVGTNYMEGKEILSNSGLKIYGEDDLDEAAKKIVSLV